MLVFKYIVIFFLAVFLTAGCTIKNCLYCQNNGQICNLCKTDFSPSVSGSCIKQTITKCRIYKTTSQCEQCEPTYKTTLAGLCEKDYSGCILRSKTKKCEACIEGTILSQGRCYGTVGCQNNPITF